MLKEIEKQLAGPVPVGMAKSIVINCNAWDKIGETIAGLSHLPHEQQLVRWAQNKGWIADYETKHRVVRITRPE